MNLQCLFTYLSSIHISSNIAQYLQNATQYDKSRFIFSKTKSKGIENGGGERGRERGDLDDIIKTLSLL